MGRLIRWSLVVMVFVSACAVSDNLWAGKGGGGGKGGGSQSGGKNAGGGHQGHGFKSDGSKGGGHSHAKAQTSGEFGGSHAHGNGKSSNGGQFAHGKKTSPSDPSSQLTGNHPGDKQRTNEERKLEHRQKVADHLREISKKNGNENLNDVADRLDQKAQEHYEKRIEKLNSRDGVPDDALADEGDALSEVAEALDDAEHADEALDDAASPQDQIADAAEKLTGRENALYRQLRNEERKLNQRMAQVERLNQLYDQTGDADYLDAAERLESMSLDHYEKRLAKITEFQERFNLPAFEDAPVPVPAP